MHQEVASKLERVYDMFDTSFLHGEEIILHKKWNVYFRIVVDLWPQEGIREIKPIEFDYKLLSYLSFYTAGNHFNKGSVKCKWAWNKINRWFRLEFTYEELQKIYQKLGCGANMPLGIDFIKSGFDMQLLRKEKTNV